MSRFIRNLTAPIRHHRTDTRADDARVSSTSAAASPADRSATHAASTPWTAAAPSGATAASLAPAEVSIYEAGERTGVHVIPGEVMSNIMDLLPPSSRLAASQVCKRWRDVTRNAAQMREPYRRARLMFCRAAPLINGAALTGGLHNSWAPARGVQFPNAVFASTNHCHKGQKALPPFLEEAASAWRSNEYTLEWGVTRIADDLSTLESGENTLKTAPKTPYRASLEEALKRFYGAYTRRIGARESLPLAQEVKTLAFQCNAEKPHRAYQHIYQAFSDYLSIEDETSVEIPLSRLSDPHHLKGLLGRVITNEQAQTIIENVLSGVLPYNALGSDMVKVIVYQIHQQEILPQLDLKRLAMLAALDTAPADVVTWIRSAAASSTVSA